MKRRYCDLDGQELKLLPLRQRKLVRNASRFLTLHCSSYEGGGGHKPKAISAHPSRATPELRELSTCPHFIFKYIQ